MATGLRAAEDEADEEDDDVDEVGVVGLTSSLRACGVLEELPELRGLIEPSGGDFLLETTPFSRGDDVPLTAGLTAALDSCPSKSNTSLKQMFTLR